MTPKNPIEESFSGNFFDFTLELHTDVLLLHRCLLTVFTDVSRSVEPGPPPVDNHAVFRSPCLTHYQLARDSGMDHIQAVRSVSRSLRAAAHPWSTFDVVLLEINSARGRRRGRPSKSESMGRSGAGAPPAAAPPPPWCLLFPAYLTRATARTFKHRFVKPTCDALNMRRIYQMLRPSESFHTVLLSSFSYSSYYNYRTNNSFLLP